MVLYIALLYEREGESEIGLMQLYKDSMRLSEK